MSNHSNSEFLRPFLLLRDAALLHLQTEQGWLQPAITWRRDLGVNSTRLASQNTVFP